jgi:hypothetical protein
MGRRGITTFALGAVVGVTACAGLSSGVLADGTAALAGAAQGVVRVPQASAAELPAFDDCDQLRRWYVDAALREVGPWGFGDPRIYTWSGGARAVPSVPGAESADGAVAADTSTQGAVGSSDSGTNVQEADVDESDVAKTDGTLLVRVAGRSLVVTDVSGDRPRELSRTPLPGPTLQHPELLLRGDRVVVVGNELTLLYRGDWDPADSERRIIPRPRTDTRARVVSVDVSDPAAPRVVDDRHIDGGVVSSRQYADGTVRVVVSTGHPDLDFVHPTRGRSLREATTANRRIVRQAPLSAWLPAVGSSSGRERPPACSDVRHPVRSSGLGTISVLGFPFDHPDAVRSTAVTTAGDLVYSSAHRLYVATTTEQRASVHAFALDGASTRYVGSGTLPGTVEDRWSFSEHDGHLRVATALGSSWQPRDNAIVVLTEHAGALAETGRVDGLGRGERIQAVRWFGDLAVVVTFRQTDPLYTVDLADPARPRVRGALEIPGFSTYLHPLGGDLLLGLGHDATPTGADLGAQAATFDLRDLRDVRRTDTLSFGRNTGLAVDTDPRALTYLPALRTLVTTVADWDGSGSRLVALHVAPDGTLTRTGAWATARYLGEDVRVLPIAGGRVALVDDDVRVVHVG